MLQSIYDQMTEFYDSIEEEYATFFDNSWEWEHFHFKFLIYYLVRYGIGCRGILSFTIIVLLIVCILKR